jgi:oxygen-independent coproporphyrinogen-3 oxidase
LEKALDVQSTHISVYDLQVEENTAFGRWYSPGIFPLPTEESSTNLYLQAVSTLSGSWPTEGFEHYEVSNYAKAGFRSRHNQKYWACSDVIGLGMSAASLVQGVRLTRPKSRSEYERWVTDQQRMEEKRFNDNSNSNSKSKSINRKGDQYEIGDNDNYDFNSNLEVVETPVDILERIMLALRTADGLCLGPLRNEYGDIIINALVSSMLPFVESGHVRFISMSSSSSSSSSSSTTNDNSNASEVTSVVDKIQLTDPSGFLISNTIISTVFAAIQDFLS